MDRRATAVDLRRAGRAGTPVRGESAPRSDSGIDACRAARSRPRLQRRSAGRIQPRDPCVRDQTRETNCMSPGPPEELAPRIMCRRARPAIAHRRSSLERPRGPTRSPSRVLGKSGCSGRGCANQRTRIYPCVAAGEYLATRRLCSRRVVASRASSIRSHRMLPP